MEENYEDLIGKKIKYVWSDGTEFDAHVEMIDRYVGLTIRGEDGTYRACINGPSSPLFHKQFKSEKQYFAEFDKCVELIRIGRVEAGILIRLLESEDGIRCVGGKVLPSTCAFNQ